MLQFAFGTKFLAHGDGGQPNSIVPKGPSASQGKASADSKFLEVVKINVL